MTSIDNVRALSASNTGREISRSCSRSGKSLFGSKTAADELDVGFTKILQDSGTTDDEKAIARLGLALGAGSGISPRFAYRIKSIIMRAVAEASSISGPIGSALGGILSEAADSGLVSRLVYGGSWENRTKALAAGFAALRQDPAATPVARGVAGVGAAVGGIPGIGAKKSAVLRMAVSSALRCGIPSSGPVGAAMASAAEKALQIDLTPDERAGALIGVLEAIRTDGWTSDIEKGLGELGLAILASKDIDNNAATRGVSNIFDIMKQSSSLTGPVRDVMASALAKVASQSGAESDSRNILRIGLKALSESRFLSEPEREAAKLGALLGSGDNISCSSAIKARLAVIDALGKVSSYQGSRASLLAHIASAACRGLKDSEVPAVLLNGLKAISESSAATDREKVLARFGMLINSDNLMDSASLAKARGAVMDFIAGKGSGAGSVLDGVVEAAKTVSSGHSVRDASLVLKAGLSVIAEMQGASDVQKALAQLGVKVGVKDVSPDASRDVRLAAIEAAAGNPSPQPTVSALLAGLALDVVGSGLQKKESAALLGILMDTIEALPASTPLEKAAASIGRNLKPGAVEEDGACKTRSCIAQALRKGSTSSATLGGAIASLAGSLSTLPISDKDKAKSLECGLKTISELKSATEMEKILAKMGLAEAGSPLPVRKGFLEAIANLPAAPQGSECRILAKAALDVIKSGVSDGDARKVLRKSFDLLLENPRLSDIEKALAKYGVAVGNNENLLDGLVVRSRLRVMEEMAVLDGVSGFIGRQVAGAAGDAAESCGSWNEARSALKDLFTSIGKSKLATDQEKALANLGLSIAGADGIENESAAKARLCVAKKMAEVGAKGYKGSFLGVLVDAVSDAVKAQKTYPDQRKMLRAGFEQMTGCALLKDYEKKEAKKGLDAGAKDGMSDPAAVRARLQVLDHLRDLAENPDAEMKKLLGFEKPKEDATLTDHEEFIAVDGVKLRKKARNN